MCQGHCRPAPLFLLQMCNNTFPQTVWMCEQNQKSGGKKRVPTSSEWMIHANTNQHYRLESNNQVIGLRVTLFGRKRLSCPARTANSCVRRYLLRRERDGYFRTEMCQVLRQEKATQVPHSLAHVALAFCGVIQVSGRLTVQFASNLSYRTMVYGPIGIITFQLGITFMSYFTLCDA